MDDDREDLHDGPEQWSAEAREILTTRAEETPGLEQVRFATTVITHDGEADETFDDDPFAIVRPSDGD